MLNASQQMTLEHVPENALKNTFSLSVVVFCISINVLPFYFIKINFNISSMLIR